MHRRSKKYAIVIAVVLAAWLGLSMTFMEESVTRGLQSDEEGEQGKGDEEVHDQQDEEIEEEQQQDEVEGEAPEEPEIEIDEDKEVSVEGEKPVMHTFYESVKNGCCGMTTEGHDMLLNAWRESWEERGWETKVLTMEDAKKHPDFDLLDERLAFLQVTPYNRRCFWRWLAMASLENEDGGWMSDYDLFPLELDAARANEITKDDDGTFKSYAWHIPCLIHASRSEWDRVIHLMIDILPEERGSHVTDMLTLQNVDYELGRSGMKWMYDVAPNDIERNFLYSLDENDEMFLNCEIGAGKLAVHLSHFGTAESWKYGLYPLDDIEDEKEAVEKRGDAAVKMMHDYRDGCIASTE